MILHAKSQGVHFHTADVEYYQDYREIQERSQWPTFAFLGCELQNLVLRVLLCCWEFCQWSLATHAFCVLTTRQFTAKWQNRQLRKVTNHRHTHTHICLVQWKAEDFFCGLCLHNQQTAGSGSCCSPCALGWPRRRRKAKNARVGCRFLPVLIYSLEFHNNFSIIDTESCTSFSLRYALVGLSAFQILNSPHKLIYQTANI